MEADTPIIPRENSLRSEESEEEQSLVSQENAELEIEKLFEWYDIDVDDYKDDPDESDGAVFLKSRKKIIRAVKSGMVEIVEGTDGQGDPTLKVKQKLRWRYQKYDSDHILYREVSGKSKSAVRTQKKQGDYSRMYQFLGGLSGEGEPLFLKLRGIDNSIAECLGFIFLQV